MRCISEESRSGGDDGGGGEVLFQSLSTELSQLVRRRADFYTSAPTEARLGLPLEDLPGLFAPLLTMAICLHSSPDTINQVLLSAATALETLSASSSRYFPFLPASLCSLLSLQDSGRFSVVTRASQPPLSAPLWAWRSPALGKLISGVRDSRHILL